MPGVSNAPTTTVCKPCCDGQLPCRQASLRQPVAHTDDSVSVGLHVSNDLMSGFILTDAIIAGRAVVVGDDRVVDDSIPESCWTVPRRERGGVNDGHRIGILVDELGHDRVHRAAGSRGTGHRRGASKLSRLPGAEWIVLPREIDCVDGAYAFRGPVISSPNRSADGVGGQRRARPLLVWMVRYPPTVPPTHHPEVYRGNRITIIYGCSLHIHILTTMKCNRKYRHRLVYGCPGP